MHHPNLIQLRRWQELCTMNNRNFVWLRHNIIFNECSGRKVISFCKWRESSSKGCFWGPWKNGNSMINIHTRWFRSEYFILKKNSIYNTLCILLVLVSFDSSETHRNSSTHSDIIILNNSVETFRNYYNPKFVTISLVYSMRKG